MCTREKTAENLTRVVYVPSFYSHSQNTDTRIDMYNVQLPRCAKLGRTIKSWSGEAKVCTLPVYIPL